jgi:rare lipoprotein A
MARVVESALLGTLLAGLFTGCSTSNTLSKAPNTTERHPGKPVNIANIPEPSPRQEPPSLTGNPDSYAVFGKRYYVLGTSEGYRKTGIASWYGSDFHGKKTSSGPPFDMYAVSAAHKSLPLPTYVKVTHLHNGRSIVVKVNDRGPFVDDRIIDLSYAAAEKLDMIEEGTAPVEVVALPPYQYLASYSPDRTKRALALERNQDGSAAITQITQASPAKPARNTAIAAYRVPQPGQNSSSARRPVTPQLVYTSFSKPGPTISNAVYRPSPKAVSNRSTQSASGSLLYLQVGAFSERNHAKQLQQKLASRFSQTVRVDSSARNLHKVRIGPLNDPVEAQRLTVKLASLGIKAHPVSF